MSGLVAGAFYHSDCWGVKSRLRLFPRSFVSLLRTATSSVELSNQPQLDATTLFYRQANDGNTDSENNIVRRRYVRPAQPSETVPVVLQEEDVQTLISMGFNREQVESALLRTNGNLERASNVLLDQGS